MEHLYRRRRDAFGESEVSEFVRPVVGVPEVKPAGPQWMMLPRPGESERERGRARVAPRTDMMTYLYCICRHRAYTPSALGERGDERQQGFMEALVFHNCVSN